MGVQKSHCVVSRLFLVALFLFQFVLPVTSKSASPTKKDSVLRAALGVMNRAELLAKDYASKGIRIDETPKNRDRLRVTNLVSKTMSSETLVMIVRFSWACIDDQESGNQSYDAVFDCLWTRSVDLLSHRNDECARMGLKSLRAGRVDGAYALTLDEAIKLQNSH